jgi:cytidylate kinase
MGENKGIKIAISGLTASGKSTLAKNLADYFNIKKYSAGEIFRNYARERGLDIEKLSLEAEEKLDKIADEETKRICNFEDNFVIEGRLTIYFCETSFKIYIYADKEIRAKRLALRENLNFEEALKRLEERDSYDLDRYKKIYKIEDYEREMKKIANLIIDSSNLSIEEVFNISLSKLKEFFKIND